MSTSKAWWKESVVYQIYPRSFQDSDGDGIGDIPGILSRLDYLEELGVDVVWLCPVYESPNDDNGYDISHYRRIMKEFGTMRDWEKLLEGLHARGMKLIMDLVVNHTSDEHAWFAEARLSKDSPYRDYYIWRDGRDGREPNDWSSFFSGSAWKYDEAAGQYYLHLFSQRQPDLNWDNPKVRREVYDMMTWWLDKGIDGFRMDVINLISKAPGLPDAGGDGRYSFGGEHFMNGPRVHEHLQEMNREVLSRYDVMTVGETPGVTPEEAANYVGEERGELNMVFQFEHMDLDSGHDKWDVRPWKLRDFKAVMGKWQRGLAGKGWNSLYLNNHDQPRMVSRFGDDGRYRKESAKLLGTLLHTLQGTPYIYQGEELGMTNVRFGGIEHYRDIETLNMHREHLEGGRDERDILQGIYAKGRDNARTPMQWDASAQAGFTSGEPWIAVNPNYTDINAEESRRDPDSIFHYYRRLIELRRAHVDAIVYGRFEELLEEHEAAYVYTRTAEAGGAGAAGAEHAGEAAAAGAPGAEHADEDETAARGRGPESASGNAAADAAGDAGAAGEKLLVALNFSAEPAEVELPENAAETFGGGELLLGNLAPEAGRDWRRFTLRPYEAVVVKA
ncbi:alpha-glucosidase [Paenibacillus albicereus]|uniref:oligo-1,6-glucosidase n=1 Tax=Paenibacillus albicereus TaxID=2726185 RepID=A0A6H2GTP4_9BACL|nr:alpha-glucosidase [Paenibacillus albicereus]QJC50791.1 alpha-glucosidase [Paenibacillus albicereus]